MASDADSDLIVATVGDSLWSYDVDTDAASLVGEFVPPIDPPVAFYHDPSGLVVFADPWMEAVWAYDVEANTAYDLGGMTHYGLLTYDPLRDRFYLVVPAFFQDPETLQHGPGLGWTQLQVATPDFRTMGGDFVSGIEVPLDEATGEAVVFSGGVLATFDPAVRSGRSSIRCCPTSRQRTDPATAPMPAWWSTLPTTG
jgi:hypothetical protein